MASILRGILILTSFTLAALLAVSIKRALTWVVAEYLSNLPQFLLHLFFNLYTYVPLLITAIFVYFVFDNTDICCGIWNILCSIALGVTVFQLMFYLFNLILGPSINFSNEIVGFAFQHLLPFAIAGISIGIFNGLIRQNKFFIYSVLASFLTVLWMFILGSYRMYPLSIPEWLNYVIVFGTCISFTVLTTYIVLLFKPKKTTA